MGIYQLNRLEQFVKKRNEIADKYRKGLKQTDSITLFNTPSHIRHSYYKFPILIDEAVDPESLMQLLKSEYGISTGRVYWPPCHLQPLYMERFNCKEGMFPVAEEILRRVICLPVHVSMVDRDIDYVLTNLKKAINMCSKVRTKVSSGS